MNISNNIGAQTASDNSPQLHEILELLDQLELELAANEPRTRSKIEAEIENLRSDIVNVEWQIEDLEFEKENFEDRIAELQDKLNDLPDQDTTPEVANPETA